MEIIAKDTRFYSNALSPFQLSLNDSKRGSDIELPIDFVRSESPNVNFSQIQELKVFFHRLTNLEKPIDHWKKSWVLIKNIGLIEKEAL